MSLFVRAIVHIIRCVLKCALCTAGQGGTCTRTDATKPSSAYAPSKSSLSSTCAYNGFCACRACMATHRSLMPSRNTGRNSILSVRSAVLLCLGLFAGWVVTRIGKGYRAEEPTPISSVASQSQDTSLVEDPEPVVLEQTVNATLTAQTDPEIESEDDVPIVDVLNEAQARACFTDKCSVVREAPIALDTSLLVGILSKPEADVEYRAAVRDTWLGAAKSLPGVHAFFYFNAAHPALAAENATHGDILIVPPKDTSVAIGVQMLLHFSQHHPARLILRANVRQYIAVGRLLTRITDDCATPSCISENIWAGSLVRNRTVDPAAPQYKTDTGLESYLPYMTTDAYVMTHALAAALRLMHESIGLRSGVGPEDVAMALWLVPIPVRI